MDYKEYIQKKLSEKGINKETQNYVIKYVDINKQLFGNFIDIDKMINRILNNLNHNITCTDKTKNPLFELIRITLTRGVWLPYENKILINPSYKLLSKISTQVKKRLDSTVFHEIDHCATTEYIKISNQEKEEYIHNMLNNLKNNNKVQNNILVKYIKKEYEKRKGVLAVSGIFDFRHNITSGISLKNLNEGITAYKQEMYDKHLGNKSYTSYGLQKRVAKLIGSVIGESNLINLHFNNDYNGIRNSFNEKTGLELNDLINLMNKKSKFKTFFFGKLYTKSFYKKIDKFMEPYETKKDTNIQTKSNSFRDSLVVESPTICLDQKFHNTEQNNKNLEPRNNIEQ